MFRAIVLFHDIQLTLQHGQPYHRSSSSSLGRQKFCNGETKCSYGILYLGASEWRTARTASQLMSFFLRNADQDSSWGDGVSAMFNIMW